MRQDRLGWYARLLKQLRRPSTSFHFRCGGGRHQAKLHESSNRFRATLRRKAAKWASSVNPQRPTSPLISKLCVDAVPDHSGDVGAAESLDGADAGWRGHVDFREVTVDHV